VLIHSSGSTTATEISAINGPANNAAPIVSTSVTTAISTSGTAYRTA
jgi:hypothetical protein